MNPPAVIPATITSFLHSLTSFLHMSRHSREGGTASDAPLFARVRGELDLPDAVRAVELPGGDSRDGVLRKADAGHALAVEVHAAHVEPEIEVVESVLPAGLRKIVQVCWDDVQEEAYLRVLDAAGCLLLWLTSVAPREFKERPAPRRSRDSTFKRRKSNQP